MDFAACMYLIQGTGFNPEWLIGIGELLTAGAVIVGGIWGFRKYREGQKLKAADMLLEMEKEFRGLLDICNKVEVLDTYERSIKPILDKLNRDHEKAVLNEKEEEPETMRKLDRALRFFYVCAVLNGELHVEKDVIGRAYYYWLLVFADAANRPELTLYIKENYKRFHQWLEKIKPYLDNYKETGKWVKSRKGISWWWVNLRDR